MFGCIALGDPEVNAKWIDLFTSPVPVDKGSISLQDKFLRKYRLLHPEDLVPHIGLNFICLDNNLTHAHGKAVSIKGSSLSEPGLNIIISCTSTVTAKDLNDDPEVGNSSGYYYIGFDDNVHFVNNVFILPSVKSNLNISNDFKHKTNASVQSRIQNRFTNFTKKVIGEKDFSFAPSNSVENRIRKLAELDAWHKGPQSVYFTKENIIAKLLTLVSKLDEQEADDKKPEASKLKVYPTLTRKQSGFCSLDGTQFSFFLKFLSDTKSIMVSPEGVLERSIVGPLRNRKEEENRRRLETERRWKQEADDFIAFKEKERASVLSLIRDPSTDIPEDRQDEYIELFNEMKLGEFNKREYNEIKLDDEGEYNERNILDFPARYFINRLHILYDDKHPIEEVNTENNIEY